MRLRIRPHHVAAIPQASLPDIAFLLLIFFVSTTTFDVETGIALVLPGESSPRVQVKRSNVILITSDASGGIQVDGVAMPLERVHEVVAPAVQQNPRLIVSLETHPEATYGVMVGMLDQVKMARAQRISLKMARRGSGPGN